MPIEDIEKFEILIATQGEKSQVISYLKDLQKSNPDLFDEAIDDLILIKKKLILKQDIKYFKNGKKSLFELRVKHKNNICRFFFDLQKPNVIIIYGFTKKTQKTEKKDIKLGFRLYDQFQEDKTSLSLTEVLSKLEPKNKK